MSFIVVITCVLMLLGRLIFYAYWEHHPCPVSPYLNRHSVAAPNLR